MARVADIKYEIATVFLTHFAETLRGKMCLHAFLLKMVSERIIHFAGANIFLRVSHSIYGL